MRSPFALIGAVSTALACAAGGPGAKSAPAVPLFPLQEEARIPCRGSLLPGIDVLPGGLVLLATRDGWLQAVDRDSRSVRWEIQMETGLPVPPVVAEGRIVAVDEAGTGYGLDAGGKTAWTRKGVGRPEGALTVLGSRVVYRLRAGDLAAFESADGTPAWRIESEPGPPPASWGTGIVVCNGGGSVRIIGFDGRFVSGFETGEAVEGTPFVRGNRIFVALAGGRLRAFDLPGGKQRWSVRPGGAPVGLPAGDARRLYLAISSNVLVALNAARGDLLWWRPLDGRAIFGPVVSGAHLFALSRAPTLQAVDRDSGESAAAFDAGGEARTGPVLIDAATIGFAVDDPIGEKGYLIVLKLPSQGDTHESRRSAGPRR